MNPLRGWIFSLPYNLFLLGGGIMVGGGGGAMQGGGLSVVGEEEERNMSLSLGGYFLLIMIFNFIDVEELLTNQ